MRSANGPGTIALVPRSPRKSERHPQDWGVAPVPGFARRRTGLDGAEADPTSSLIMARWADLMALTRYDLRGDPSPGSGQS